MVCVNLQTCHLHRLRLWDPSATNRNEYQKCVMEVKEAGA
jgi:hypothetical protein